MIDMLPGWHSAPTLAPSQPPRSKRGRPRTRPVIQRRPGPGRPRLHPPRERATAEQVSAARRAAALKRWHKAERAAYRVAGDKETT